MVIWLFRPGSKKLHDDAANQIFRNEDRPKPPETQRTKTAMTKSMAEPSRNRSRNPGSGPEPGFTGHEWDGIKEYDNPLPRWWLWIFWATVIWSLGYWVLYPAWPLVTQATQGVLG
jgi:hypothetical protein